MTLIGCLKMLRIRMAGSVLVTTHIPNLLCIYDTAFPALLLGVTIILTLASQN